MSRRRLLPLGIGVIVLTALAAVAAHGRPLSGGSGGAGPSTTFFDYVFTTFVILEVLAIVLWIVVIVVGRRQLMEEAASRRRAARWLGPVSLVALVALGFFLSRHIGHLTNGPGHHAATLTIPGTGTLIHEPGGGGGQAHLPPIRWDEVGVVGFVLLAAAIAVAVALMRRATRSPRATPAEALSDVLDESLDDLRNDPDLRRAIVAAYARMEHALAVSGLPRHPAEAPLEYLERALLSLDASAGSVRRLTELFEWARFSHHELEPQMRDEAIDALVSVRDELRGLVPVPA